MSLPSHRRSLALALAAAGLCLAAQVGAQSMARQESGLHALAKESPRFAQTGDVLALGEARHALALDAELGFDEFARAAGGTWSAQVDARTGFVSSIDGSGIPWLAGAGNDLAATGSATLAELDGRARGLARVLGKTMGFDPDALVLNEGRSGHPAPHVWFVDYDVVAGGHRIEGARVVFVVNSGNLISVGTENLPAAGLAAPVDRIGVRGALDALGKHVGGFLPEDLWVDAGSYRVLPANRGEGSFAEVFTAGAGRELVGVWQFVFRRPGEVGTFRGRVDAATGEVLDFYDVNEYGAVTGGVFQGDRPSAERVLPMPFADVATSTYTNSAGIFAGTSGTSTLNGQYVRVVDSCGAISKAADGSGNIAFGSGSGTDCTTPGTGGAGNTHAARTQFYNLNRAKEVARGWLPTNSWINAKLTANVNLNQTCNAYWNGSSVNFFRSGGGCANTGELPGVSLHEYGHGLDSNDGNGSSPENGTGETYGDFTAALATHNSCIGNGFLGSSNCGGYGDACTSCSGVRDIDWAKRVSNTPHTVANFTQSRCPTRPGYVGPCNREGHCESYIGSEALWDLAMRDMPGAGTGAAWTVVDRLWYLSRSTGTKSFQCTTTSSPWTSNGCNTGSLFKVFRAVDDDNGNLADGTPHGGAIAAAFNRHGIACTTDAGWNTTFAAVTPPATPSLTVTAGNNSASLSWSGSSGVYDVYRNETGCNAGFTKVANNVSTTSYADNAVANGLTYYYQVVAHPSSTEAAASAPSTCRSVTPAGGGGCTPPAAPTGVSASASSQTAINVSWSAASGATSYKIFRSTTSGSGYTQVGTSTTTSFADSGLACNTTYYYVVTASNGTCDSGNSAQASAATQACSGGNVLSNGVPVTGISGAASSQQYWTMNVPSGASNLVFQISGGTGDADMYVRFGAQPTTSTYNCRPYLSGNNETCTFAAPSAGTWHVMLRGYSAYSGVSLVGSYQTGSTCTAVAETETNDTISTADPLVAPCSTVAGTFVGETGTSDYFSMSVPAGATVTSLLNGLSVDYDLYVYNSAGTQLGSSTNGGTTADQVAWTNNTGATASIRVRVYKYAATRTTYALRVSY
jgi:hypothetical protein